MATLYRTYTVVVQDSSTYEPKNDLELLLYEGKLAVKPNPAAGGDYAVFQYGTANLAVAVLDKNGVAAVATAADGTDRPGEYDFSDLDLDATTAGNSGSTLYSVVARPSADSASNSFSRAKVIVENTDISDPNVKQLVKDSTGGLSTLGDNLQFAGGTVEFEHYGSGSDATVQYLKLTSLSDSIAALTEIVSAYPAYATSTKLLARFNVYHTNATGSTFIVWQGVPCYQTVDDSWVIRLQADEYNIFRSDSFGSGEGEINLNAVYTLFAVSVNFHDNNIHVRAFDTKPASVSFPTVTEDKERTVVSSFIDGSAYVAGIGPWTYADASNTPYYNLDVRGTRGSRIRVGSILKLEVDGTSSTIGYNTAAGSRLAMSASTVNIYAGAVNVFQITAALARMGVTATYPSFLGSATAAKIAGSLSTYFSADTSENVWGYMKVGASSIRILSGEGGSGLVKFGYDLSGTPTYLGFTSATTVLSVLNVNKITATASSVLIGTTASAYPRFSAASTYVRMEASATSYVEALSTNEQIRVYVNSKNVADFAGTSAYTKLGYDIGTGCYSHYTSSAYSVYLGTTLKTALTATIASFGVDVTSFASPAVYGTSTYIQLNGVGGTPKTYWRVDSSHRILGFMEVSGASKQIFSANETSTVVQIGYGLGSTKNYFAASSTYSQIVYGGVPRLFADSTSVGVGIDATLATFPRVNCTSTYSALMSSSGTYWSATSSGTLVGYVGTAEKILLSSSESSIKFDANTYITLTSSSIDMRQNNPASPTTQYSYVRSDFAYVRLFSKGGSGGLVEAFSETSAGAIVAAFQLQPNTKLLASTSFVVTNSSLSDGITADHVAGYGVSSSSEPYWKIPYQAGVPTGTAPKGSMIFVGSARFYINTDGATTWRYVMLI